MAVPEVLLQPQAAAEVPAAPPVGRSRSRARGVLVGALLGVAGAVLIWTGLVTLGDLSTLMKVAIVLAGCVLLFQSVTRIGREVVGPGFDAGFWLSLAWLVLLVLAAVFADVLPLGEHVDTAKTLTTPGYAQPDLLSAHPLGTNGFALDLLARCIYGARVTLLTVTLAVAVSLVIGTALGLLAGYARGWLDTVLGVAIDAMMAFPALILLIALAAVLGIPTSPTESILKTGFALAIVGVPTMARLARANAMAVAQNEFVLAAQSLGARTRRVLLRELLPNVILPMVSFAFIILAVLVIAEGSLAFLGLGLQPPQPTWGNMIAEGGSDTLRRNPHVTLVPGAFMFLTVFAFNRIGEAARKIWDPREAAI